MKLMKQTQRGQLNQKHGRLHLRLASQQLPGAIAMGIAIGNASDGISRQPEATGNIRTNLMLGLVFIETLIIYALIVAILLYLFFDCTTVITV